MNAVDENNSDVVARVAIIGAGVRVAGAECPESLWRRLARAEVLSRRLSPEELKARGIPSELLDDPAFVPVISEPEQLECFDERLFGMTAAEAQILDPQHRLLLECTQRCFDHAGYDPERLGENRVGIYVGVGAPGYLLHQIWSRPSFVSQVGRNAIFFANDKGFAATRISHRFDFTGPSVTIDTACSSSLSAVHYAFRSLLSYDCELAVAGAASVVFPRFGYRYERDGIRSEDGRCRPFDARGEGTLFGSGAGLVLLKRLEDAIADEDSIIAVLCGSALNNDGRDKAGFTAPSALGQARVISEALAFADLTAADITYVEAHGTGTPIGDPIEIRGLNLAFADGSKHPGCALGSIKANLGHLDTAAGVLGLIKTAQAVHHGMLPPLAGYEQANAAVPLSEGPFEVNERLRPWEAKVRRAGVSALGIGGTNVHVLVEQAPAPVVTPTPQAVRPSVLVLSAHDPTCLDEMAKSLAGRLSEPDAPTLQDTAFTLWNGRRQLEHRVAVVAADRAEAMSRLVMPGTGRVTGSAKDSASVAFLIPGQGCLRPGMLTGLYWDEPVFRKEIDRCSAALHGVLDVSLADLFGHEPPDWATRVETEPGLAQPATFAACLGLARLWIARGVQPTAVVGHSLGEYVAACIAGVFEPEVAVRLVAERGRLVSQCPPGALLAVSTSVEQIEAQLDPRLDVAAVNAPTQCVVSGDKAVLEQQRRIWVEAGVECRWLRASQAFHSRSMNRCVEALVAAVCRAEPRRPRIPMTSSVTGTWLEPERAADPAYWGQHLTQTVRFADALEVVVQTGSVLLEVGPGQTLTSLARSSVGERCVVIPSARRANNDPFDSDRERLLATAAALWCHGCSASLLPEHIGPGRRVRIPGLTFRRRRHWVEDFTEADAGSEGVAMLDEYGWCRIDALTPTQGSTPLCRIIGSSATASTLTEAGLRVEAVGLVETEIFDDFEALGARLTHESPLTLIVELDDCTTRDEALLDALERAGASWPESTSPRVVVVALTPDASDLASCWAHQRRKVTEVAIVCLVGLDETTAGERLVELLASTETGLMRADDRGWARFEIRAVVSATQERRTASANERSWIVLGAGRPATASALVSVADEGDSVVLVDLDGGPIPGAVPTVPSSAAAAEAIRSTMLDALDEPVASPESLELGAAERKQLEGSLDRAAGLLAAEILAQVGSDFTPPSDRALLRLLAMLRRSAASRVDSDELDRVRTVIEQRLPSLRPAIEFLVYCARQTPSVLRADRSGIEVLFPGGDEHAIDVAFRSLLSVTNFELCALRVTRLALAMSSTMDRPLRILEIGGGKGELTRRLTAALDEADVEYTFTDIGPSFVRRARDRATSFGRTRLRFVPLDVSRDLVAQGFEPEGFDLVVGFDVVHATPRIEQTLGHLHEVIAPAGQLVLIETIRAKPWVEMIWGLTADWWSFEDLELRKTTPLLGIDEWVETLTRSPFTCVRALGGQSDGHGAAYGVLWAAREPEHSPGRATERRHSAAWTHALENRQQLTDVLVERGVRVRWCRSSLDQETMRRDLPNDSDGVILVRPEGHSNETYPPSWSVLRQELMQIDDWRAKLRRPPLKLLTVGQTLGGPPGRDTDERRGLSVHLDLSGDPEVDRRAMQHALAQDDGFLALHRIDQAEVHIDAEGSTGVRARMSELWRVLLGSEPSDGGAGFFEQGGDSLVAAQMAARVRDAFKVDLSVKDILEAQTFGAMVRSIEDAQQVTDAPVLRRIGREGPLPVSCAQQSLWFAEQLAGPSATYNIPGAVRLRGPLDIESLRRSLEEILRRHEILRTVFEDEDGIPIAVIKKGSLESLPTESVEESQVASRARAFALEPFEISVGPLFRALLLKIDHDEHILLVNMHHIVSDGWSLGILVQEMIGMYSAFCTGRQPNLSPLPLQYVDFADWQQRALEQGHFDSQRAYWSTQLKGIAPLNSLPIDSPSRTSREIDGRIRRFCLPHTHTSQVHALAHRSGATTFIVLLTAFELAVLSQTGSTDMVVGTTSGNRDQTAFESMIGLFVNNLALRTDWGGDPTLEECIARVRKTSLDAFANQDLPFIEVVRDLAVERSRMHSPMFQLLFVLQKLEQNFDIPGLSASTVELDDLHTKFDVSLFMEEKASGLTGALVYDASIFSEARMEKLVSDFEHAVTAMLENTQQRASDALKRLSTEGSASGGLKVKAGRARRERREPVRSRHCPGVRALPMMTSAMPGVDLPAWVQSHREQVEQRLDAAGAVLFRGFGGADAGHLEAVGTALCGRLHTDYGDLPPEPGAAAVYGATPYPADRAILFHNESSHLRRWPLRQMFQCHLAADEGGQTPLVDIRKVAQELSPAMRRGFAERGLRYTRTFIPSIDVSWQRFFRTERRDEVERHCRAHAMELQWRDDGGVQTWIRRGAFARHPRTGEIGFFNQIALHHSYCLDPSTRASLLDIYGPEGLPRNVCFGDGTPIPDEWISEIRSLMERLSVRFDWKPGDILVLDNMLVAHARAPYQGDRKIVVAMGQMIDERSLKPVDVADLS